MKEPEELSAPDAARRRFSRIQLMLMVVFSVAIILSVLLLRAVDGAAVRMLAAAAPAAVLVVWAVAFTRMIRGEDEMMYVVQLRAVAIGSGLVLFAVSLWGLFESMLGVSGFPNFLLLPAFAVAYGAVLRIQERRER